MALIRYNPQVTMMDVRPKPDRRFRQPEGTGDEAGQVVDDQRERLMARRQKRVPQV